MLESDNLIPTFTSYAFWNYLTFLRIIFPMYKLRESTFSSAGLLGGFCEILSLPVHGQDLQRQGYAFL